MKTYKREVAIGALVFLGAMSIWGVYEAGAKEMVGALSVPIFSFAGLAFGLDAYAKQVAK